MLSTFRIHFKTSICISLLLKILGIKPYKTVLHFSYDFYKLYAFEGKYKLLVISQYCTGRIKVSPGLLFNGKRG